MSRVITFLLGSIFTFLLVAFLDYICYRPINYVALHGAHGGNHTNLGGGGTTPPTTATHQHAKPSIVYVPSTLASGAAGNSASGSSSGASAKPIGVPFVVFDEERARMLVPPPKYDCRVMQVIPQYEQCAYSPDQDVYVSASILSSGMVHVSYIVSLFSSCT